MYCRSLESQFALDAELRMTRSRVEWVFLTPEALVRGFRRPHEDGHHRAGAYASALGGDTSQMGDVELNG